MSIIRDDQIRILILNESEDKNEELYRLKKGLNYKQV